MGVDYPELSPIGDSIKEMCKRSLRFIIKMTAGVGYSVVMHSVIITAFVLVIFTMFYTEESTHDLFDYVFVPFFFVYLCCMLIEVGFRLLSCEAPPAADFAGHMAHVTGCWCLILYMIPSTPMEVVVYIFTGPLLFSWSFFVVASPGLLYMLEKDDSLTTKPLLV